MHAVPGFFFLQGLFELTQNVQIPIPKKWTQKYYEMQTSRRASLYVAASSTVSGERGLFCTEALEAGAFLGFYDGKMIAPSDVPSMNPSFGMRIGGDRCIDGDPDGLPCANEAAVRRRQNAAYASYYLYNSIDKEPVAEAIGLWAVRTIKPNEEILAHYGSDYAPERVRKKYKVGKMIEVHRAQSPTDVLPFLPMHVFAPL